MIRGRVGKRNEDRGLPRSGNLPDRSARARHDEIRSRERIAEVVEERNDDVAVTVRPRSEVLVVALAGHVQHRRPLLGERVVRRLIHASRALAPAEDEYNRRRSISGESLPRRTAVARTRERRNRPADNAVARTAATRDGVREEDATRERRRQPVRKP